jgi:hypothetical protein
MDRIDEYTPIRHFRKSVTAEPTAQEWIETYNKQSQKDQTNVHAEEDHLIPGHEPTMSIDVEPEHPGQT